jgi:hypothetical protein
MLGFKIDLLRVGWNWTREAETVLGKKQCWHMQYKGKMIVWFLELIYMLYRGKEACVHNVENPLFLLVWAVSTTSHFAKRLKPEIVVVVIEFSRLVLLLFCSWVFASLFCKNIVFQSLCMCPFSLYVSYSIYVAWDPLQNKKK